MVVVRLVHLHHGRLQYPLGCGLDGHVDGLPFPCTPIPLDRAQHLRDVPKPAKHIRDVAVLPGECPGLVLPGLQFRSQLVVLFDEPLTGFLIPVLQPLLGHLVEQPVGCQSIDDTEAHGLGRIPLPAGHLVYGHTEYLTGRLRMDVPALQEQVDHALAARHVCSHPHLYLGVVDGYQEVALLCHKRLPDGLT